MSDVRGDVLPLVVVASSVSLIVIMDLAARAKLSESKLDTWDFYVTPVLGVFAFVLACLELAQGHPVQATVDSAACIYLGLRWWNQHKKRRRKMLDATMERVAEVGDKLIIVRPETATERSAELVKHG